MPGFDHRRVKLLFDAAIDLERREREDFLARACAGDDSLLAEVRSLLRSWRQAPDFLERREPSAAAGRDAGAAPDLSVLLRHWHRYELGECLGTGSQSLVYRAVDRRRRRSVAIKLLTRLDRQALARFRRETESLARIAHPAVLELYDAGAVDGIPYLAMQLVHGPTLMGARSATSVEERVDLIRQVARGLQAAHDLGIVHRDVKPGNILVERDAGGSWRSYLADFGIARSHGGPRVTRSDALIGTPSYLAPERLGDPNRELDHRSDIYALGVTLYELLIGRSPFASSSTLETLHRIRNGDLEPPGSDMPRRLRAILLHCLAVEPGARYPSAGALADDLGRFLAGEAPLAPEPRARRLRPALSFAAAALAGLATWWLVGADPARRAAPHPQDRV